MNKFWKVNFGVFCALAVLAVVFSYLVESQFIKMPEKPWHMQPSIDEDELTAEYTDEYKILDRKRLIDKYADSTRKVVVILVDAWGVPFEGSLLKEDFAVFKDVPHKEYLHERIANRTRHAEFVEFRNSAGDGLYLFGGDSLEYGRNVYVDSLGYSEKIFCQNCCDSVMLAKLDSVLQVDERRVFALTTRDSRKGSRGKLHGTLQMIADVAKKHPDVRFVVQGTHRPTLGDPKIRREHFAKWVPVVILN